MSDQVIGIPEAAKILGKTPAALRNGYKRWKIPHFKLGGQIRFTTESIKEWIDKSIEEEITKEKKHHES